jgi:hypothetical protein
VLFYYVAFSYTGIVATVEMSTLAPITTMRQMEQLASELHQKLWRDNHTDPGNVLVLSWTLLRDERTSK